MTLRNRRFAWLLALLAAFSLIAAACGDDDDETTDAGDTTEDTEAPEETDDGDDADAGDDAGDDGGDAGLSGEVIVSGSSTVEPVTARVAELFAADNPNVAISVDGPGTGDGFQIFCNGETDVSNASRAIKDEEAEVCEQNGIEWIELYVAIDGLSVITSNENDAIECLSFPDLYALLGPESTGFNTWSDANDLADELAADLGDEFGAVTTPYPDAPLVVSAPGEESGTYDTFLELALEEIADSRGQDAVARPDYQASPNDNVIVEAIAGTPTSLGWVGYSFVLENPGAIQALAVDGGGGCVEPTVETIESGEYPIARPLFIYVNAAYADEKPELAAFIDLYLADEGVAMVGEAGYVDIPAADLETARSTWADRTTGRVFS
ncbi:MAG TPA: phosphate ABC transporter substrate-binding protein PstS family protein [Acidimicrobiales bacterium]|nr:phosphate ABC transporter substrate-binding protein PstS family protein [Acidimicrobiales bacterium]